MKKKVGESKALLGTYESFNLEAASLSTPSARKRDAKLETDKQNFENVMINEITPYVALIDGITGNINLTF